MKKKEEQKLDTEATQRTWRADEKRRMTPLSSKDHFQRRGQTILRTMSVTYREEASFHHKKFVRVEA